MCADSEEIMQNDVQSNYLSTDAVVSTAVVCI